MVRDPRYSNYSSLDEKEKILLINENFNLLLQQFNLNLNALYEFWTDCKNFGFIDRADNILNVLIKHSVQEKRIWLLKKIIKNTGRRNQVQRKIAEEAILNLTKISKNNSLKYENTSSPIIVERDLATKEVFISWVYSLDKTKYSIEMYRLVYLGILCHGIEQDLAGKIVSLLTLDSNQDVKRKLIKEFNLTKEIRLQDSSKKVEENDSVVIYNSNEKQEDSSTKINVNLIDEEILKRYLNDILFSLFCIKDYVSIYKISDVISFSFKKNIDQYLSYSFYKVSSLIEERKCRQAIALIKTEILTLPLKKNEVMPFLYLLGDSYLRSEKYEKALDIFLMLQHDEIFHGKAKARINEIKKN